MSFATKIFNIFKSLIENVSVKGEDRRERCMLAQDSNRIVASRVPPLSVRLREGVCYFQAWADLLQGGW